MTSSLRPKSKVSNKGNIAIPSTHSKKSIILNTKRKYRLILGKGKLDEESCIVTPKLMKYDDGECYGTECHYGYVLIVVRWEKKYYNHPEPDGICHIGTAPDFCEELIEVNDG